jgi:hypothetical protein
LAGAGAGAEFYPLSRWRPFVFVFAITFSPKWAVGSPGPLLRSTLEDFNPHSPDAAAILSALKTVLD